MEKANQSDVRVRAGPLRRHIHTQYVSLRNIKPLLGDMKLQMLRSTVFFVGSLFVTALPAAAEGTWTIGAFAGAESDYYVGGHSAEAGISPLIAYETDRFRIGFDGVSYSLIARSDLTFGVALGVRAGPDFPDGALFEGLDRDYAVEAGLFARYDIGTAGYVGGGIMHDVSSEHHGFEADLHVGTEFALGSVGVDLSLGGKFRSADLNQYLIGVSGSEANAQRAAYTPGSSVTPYIELSASVPLSEALTLVGAVSYEHLGETYEDSPLVNRSNASSLGLGLVYQF